MRGQQWKGILIALAILMLLFGFILVMWSRQEQGLADRARPEPQVLRLEQLIANGPGDNVHVEITEFDFGAGYVVEEENGSWKEVWIPVYPAPGGVRNAADPPRSPFRVVAKLGKPNSTAELDQYCGQTTRLRGLIPSDSGLGASSDIGQKLTNMYPGTDVTRCIILEEGRTPWSPSAIKTMLFSGIGLLVGGGVAVLALILIYVRSKAAGD
jgi:hypothetical protein